MDSGSRSVVRRQLDALSARPEDPAPSKRLETPPIEAAEVRFPAADGFELVGTFFEPAGRPRAAILCNSAFGVRRRFYRQLAEWLAARGAAVLTYDFRGVGDSRPFRLRGFRARMSEWGSEDTEGALRFLADHVPQERPRVVGHSAGGQVLGLAPSASTVERLLLIASQSGWHGHWSGWERFKMSLLWRVAIPPVAEVFGYLPGFLGVGEDVPKGVAREWAWWGRDPRYLLRDGGEARRRAYSELRFPILAVSLSDDDYAPPAAVDGLLAIYSGARSEHRRLSPRDFGRTRVGHFGFFRRDVGGPLWEELGGWLLEAARAPDPGFG